MTEPFLDRERMRAFGDRERRRGMPEFVEDESFEPARRARRILDLFRRWIEAGADAGLPPYAIEVPALERRTLRSWERESGGPDRCGAEMRSALVCLLDAEVSLLAERAASRRPRSLRLPLRRLRRRDRSRPEDRRDAVIDLDAVRAELDEIAQMLDRDRREADPTRGVICSFGCAERPCAHIAHLVEAIIREEER
jgi:hypothetical protein